MVPYYNKDPKRDPNLDNHPFGQSLVGCRGRRGGVQVLYPEGGLGLGSCGKMFKGIGVALNPKTETLNRGEVWKYIRVWTLNPQRI